MTGHSCYLLRTKRFDFFQHSRTLAGAGALLLGCCSSPAQALYEIVPGQILIRPKTELPEAALQALLAAHDAEEGNAIPQINIRILNVPEERQDIILEALQHNPNIEFAEPNYLFEPDVTPNDPYFPQQWHQAAIASPTAWNTTTGSSAVTIAILDSGCTVSHPDLAGLIVPGWNFYNNNSDVTDVSGHGTAVAGAAAALGNNGLGAAGVSWNSRLMPLRVTDATGYGSSSAIASALTWAADHGARVANISYGNVSKVTSIINAAQYFQSKGGVVTASAGNETTFDSTGDNPYFLLVSATDQNDVLCSWSNTGNNVDLSAPGYNILSTYYDGASYSWCSGTSFSAPIVAGVATLVLSVNPNLTGPQVQDILKNNADDLGSHGWDASYGWGRVNAARAVAAASGAAPLDTTPPVASISAPLNTATVLGLVSVALSGSDNVGLTKLELYVDGSLKASYFASAATYLWDTILAANGIHTIVAKAYDAAGHVGSSAAVSVTVNNVLTIPDIIAPAAQITSPTDGTRVSRTAAINVTATDNIAVAHIDLYVDGIFSQTSASSSAIFKWSTRKIASGSHTLQAFAYDAAGNRGVSGVVSVTK
jgi:thermitase